MSHYLLRRTLRMAFVGLLVAVWPAPSAQAIELAAGWTVEVLAHGLPRVDNLAVDDRGRLYATLERRRRAGRLVRLEAGRVTTLLDRLNKPDGLAIRGMDLLLTEEVTDGRVIHYDLRTDQHTVLTRLDHPEGVVALADGSWILSEDTNNGRIVHLQADGTVQLIASNLRRPEGLAMTADGTLLVAETGSGKVLALRGKERSVLISKLRAPDQLALDDKGHLWITEDVRNGRLLRVGDRGLEVIAAKLNAPQGILFVDGRVLVAEQNAGRILAFTPPPVPATPTRPTTP